MSIEDRLYSYSKGYNKLPYLVKFLIGKIYMVIPNRIKYGHFYSEYLKRIEYFNNDKVYPLVEKQLQIATNEVNFYKKRNIEKLKDFPIINKMIIKESSEEFINLKNTNIIIANTGGSSGNPLRFYLESGVSRPKEKAHFNWYWQKFGYYQGDRMLMIRGAALAKNKIYEYQPIENKLAISCYLLNEKNITQIIEKINRFKPNYIHAYPSAIKNFIQLSKESKTELKVDIKAIFLGSEILHNLDRNAIGSFFNSKICHWYGHSERLIHAGNCKYSDDFHIFPFYGYAELIDQNDKVITQANKVGRIVATGFDNSVMPLIRYDTGDEAEYSEFEECVCGFKGKSFKKIYGRQHDYIFLNDNTRVSLTAFIFGQHFNEFSLINDIQLEQEIPGYIIVRITINGQEKLNEERFIEKLRKSVNNKLEVSLEIVNSIPKTLRGKHVFLKQKLK